MPADQPNRKYFTYTDDDATTWNVFGAVDAAANAIDGSTALTPGTDVWGRNTRRRHVRYAIFLDPDTFRTKKIIVYTPAAFTALTGASTLAVHVPGETATVTYTLAEKIPEKKPIAKPSKPLVDHA